MRVIQLLFFFCGLNSSGAFTPVFNFSVKGELLLCFRPIFVLEGVTNCVLFVAINHDVKNGI